MAPFKWVNTTLRNIKSAVTGTYCKLGLDHAGRPFRQFCLALSTPDHDPRFIHSAVRTGPMPYPMLIAR